MKSTRFLLAAFCPVLLRVVTFLVAIFFFPPWGGQRGAAQNVAINYSGNPPVASAMLDLDVTGGTSRGLLIPRVTTATRPAVPVNGLFIYNTTINAFEYYNGTAWVTILTGNTGWSVTGNSGLVAGTNFLGTTDGIDLVFKTTNAERMRILTGTGDVGIGTASPGARLDVTGTNTVGIRYIKTGAADGRIMVGDPTQNWSWAVGWATGGDFSLIEEGTSGNRIYVKRTSGNVGIGTSSPNNKLEVYGAAGNYPARVGSPDGWLQFGPANTGWSHFYTDRPRFYFSTGGTFDSGNIGSYDEDLSLQTSGTTRVTVLNSNGYVGISTTSPGAKLGFNNLNDGSNGADGITWYNPSPLDYGIYRTAGAWSGPNYQQLKLGWSTGITIDGGSAYGLSGTLLQPSAGTVGIGQSVKAAYTLEVNGSLGYGDGTAGSYRSRTETRNDAGLMGSQSGFFQTSAPAPAANWPPGAASWWHLLDVRHSNPANNYGMQFAGSFFDQNLYFRKTNNNPAQGWSQVLTTANSGNFIQNQYAGAQGSANYWIDGEARVGSWFRNSASGTGLYNETNGRHFYSDGGSYWSLTTGNGLIFRDAYASTIQGYVYNDGTNFGILHRGGGWGIGTSTTRAFVNQSLMVNGSGSPSYALHVLGDVYANGGWLRSSGNAGWYSESYGGGWWMTDATWIRSYNSKNVYCDQVIRADAGFQVDGNQVIDGDAGWHRTWGSTGYYNSTWNGGIYMSDADYLRTYAPSDITGIDANGPGNFGGWNATYRALVGWYSGSEPLVIPNVDWYGYVGMSGASEGWYRGYSYGWNTKSERRLKKDIAPIASDKLLADLVMEDIDRIQPSFYRYIKQMDQMVPGMETKYRPQMSVGVIADESPDYILDESFTAVDNYALAALALAGVKYNRNEIKEIKNAIGQGKTITVSDFGISEMNGIETIVSFSPDFQQKILTSTGNIPVVTVTPSNANASLYISEVTPKGFIVKNGTINQSPVTFNWIAMAKVTVTIPSFSGYGGSLLTPELLERLRVPPHKKQAAIDWWNSDAAKTSKQSK